MMKRILLTLLTLTLAIISFSITAQAQEPVETVKVRTRVVFMDALVKDKRTGTPVADLTQDSFEVLDNGKARSLTYFTQMGQARKPLALTLVLDVRPDGAGRFLQRKEVQDAIVAELSKLPAEDEVAVLIIGLDDKDDNERLWVMNWTNNRAETAQALAQIPALIEKYTDHDDEDQKIPSDSKVEVKNQDKGKVEVNVNTEPGKPETVKIDTDEIEKGKTTTTIVGKNGAVVTRTVDKDGNARVTRVSKNKHVTVEMDNDLYMYAPIEEITKRAAKERANSQPAIIWVSDGLAPVFYEERNEAEALMIRSNVIFNSLTADLKTAYKFLLPIAKPITNWVGFNIYGASQHMAKQTGGEAIKVHRADDYARGLNKIVGNLTARYNLGFTLDEAEQDDGTMHQLEVRVRARDAKGKTRKLEVSSRRGYFMPKPFEKQEEKTTASTQ